MYSELQLLHVSAARKQQHVLPAARAAVCCCHRELVYYQSKSEHFPIFLFFLNFPCMYFLSQFLSPALRKVLVVLFLTGKVLVKILS